MKREFVMLPEFDKQWKALNLDDNDLKELQVNLCMYPDSGDLMEGTGGIRKLRWAQDGRGKSGSIRVLYIDLSSYEKIYLFTAYPKNEKDNLTKEEKNAIKAVVKTLEKELEDKKKKLEGKKKK